MLNPGDLLGKISWSEYIYLLFKLEKPQAWQAELLEAVAVAIANPGPRDLSVRAAMNGGVGGSTAASCLMAALAPGAGKNGGAREVYQVMRLWQQCQFDLEQWQQNLSNYKDEVAVEVWPASEHPPGFDPYGASCATPYPPGRNDDGRISSFVSGARPIGHSWNIRRHNHAVCLWWIHWLLLLGRTGVGRPFPGIDAG